MRRSVVVSSFLRRGWLGLVGVMLATSLAHAQSTTRRIELGEGIAVARTCWRGGRGGLTCSTWTPTGLSFGDAAPSLVDARTFARVSSRGRILALSGPMTGAPVRVLWTDDGGAHWIEAPWDGGVLPTLFAFDAQSDEGVAVGESGHVWSTRDGGVHWVDHGGDARVWTTAAIARGVIVISDSSGATFRSDDGGFTRVRLEVEGAVTLEARGEEVVVHGWRSDCVVRRGDGARCARRE